MLTQRRGFAAHGLSCPIAGSGHGKTLGALTAQFQPLFREVDDQFHTILL